MEVKGVHQRLVTNILPNILFWVQQKKEV